MRGASTKYPPRETGLKAQSVLVLVWWDNPTTFFDGNGKGFELVSSLTTIGISGLLGAISSGLADLVFQD